MLEEFLGCHEKGTFRFSAWAHTELVSTTRPFCLVRCADRWGPRVWNCARLRSYGTAAPAGLWVCGLDLWEQQEDVSSISWRTSLSTCVLAMISGTVPGKVPGHLRREGDCRGKHRARPCISSEP